MHSAHECSGQLQAGSVEVSNLPLCQLIANWPTRSDHFSICSLVQAAANVTVSSPMQQDTGHGSSGSGGRSSDDSIQVVAGSDDLKNESCTDPISAPQVGVPNDWEMFMNWDREGGAGGNGGVAPASAAPGDASAAITPLHSSSLASTHTSKSLDVREGSHSTSRDTRFHGRIGEPFFSMLMTTAALQHRSLSSRLHRILLPHRAWTCWEDLGPCMCMRLVFIMLLSHFSHEHLVPI